MPLPTEVRYSSAWNEIAARVTVRININAAHLATITAVLTVYVYSLSKDGEKVSELSSIIPWIMPVITAIFVSWYIHNDRIIGILSNYCAVLERRDFEEGSVAPRFFDDSGFQGKALDLRRYSDWSTISVCFGTVFVWFWRIYEGWAVFGTKSLTEKAEYWGYISFNLVLIGFVFYALFDNKKFREQILARQYDWNVAELRQ